MPKLSSRPLVPSCGVLAALLLASAPARAQPAPIVGGSPVSSEDWPDVVAVIGAYGTCTGTLIAPDVVLTAGHCIDIGPIEVITNTLDLAAPFGGDRIRVKSARAYPRWDERYDAAVLVLDHVARPRARPIATACLANARLAAGAPLTVLGFGLVTPAGTDRNTRLHRATVPVIDAFCTDAPGCAPGARPNGEIAAGGRGTDSCFGDSGGPALVDTPQGPALVGIVSRGLDVPGAPCGNGGIYVRADKVVAWAQTVTKRRFERVACDGHADDPGGDAGADEGMDDAMGGCAADPAAGGGGAVALAMVGLAVVVPVRRRRRHRARHRAGAPVAS